MTTRLVDEYFRQRSDVLEASQTPRTVIFSHPGYSRAMNEVGASENHFDAPGGAPRTYCGLPYVIDPRATAELVVTHEFVHEVSQRVTASKPRQNAITVKIDGIMDGPPVAEIIAANLKASQLCDIIRAWLDSDDATHWGDFEKALDRAVTEHGRFE